MNLLFEEDGAFKTGTILTDNDASLQVETPHGKRLKLKSKDVLMRFAQPSAGELRGLDNFDVLRMNVGAHRTLIPRISNITANEFDMLRPKDLIAVQQEVVAFFME